METKWCDISEIEEYREHYEFNSFAVLVDDGDCGHYTDIAFGINLIPDETKRFCPIPDDEHV